MSLDELWTRWTSNREDVVPLVTFFLQLATLIGAAIVAGAALAQARTARRRHEEQTKADLERRITESFAKAVEQLGSDNLETRLGAIYTLERIARESEREYWPIMETLTAFVREHAPWPPSADRPEPVVQRQHRRFFDDGSQSFLIRTEKAQKPEIRPAADVQAILTVLGRRDETARKQEKEAGRCLDLAATCLQGADLSGVHFEDATLWGVHLEGASLKKANFDRADLIAAYFEGAYLNQAHFEYAVLKEASFERTKLAGVYLKNAYLADASFKSADFGQAHLEETDLGGVNLGGADLRSAHLERADLRGVNLEGADLRGVNLEGADLREAHLKGADLRGVNLKGAWLRCADLTGANLVDAKGLTQEDINSAICDESTTLPTGLSPDRCP